MLFVRLSPPTFGMVNRSLNGAIAMKITAGLDPTVVINHIPYNMYECDFLLDGRPYREFRDMAFSCDTIRGWMDFYKAKFLLNGKRQLVLKDRKPIVVRRYGKVEVIPGRGNFK